VLQFTIMMRPRPPRPSLLLAIRPGHRDHRLYTSRQDFGLRCGFRHGFCFPTDPILLCNEKSSTSCHTDCSSGLIDDVCTES
jgi:hypothetical protein